MFSVIFMLGLACMSEAAYLTTIEGNKVGEARLIRKEEKSSMAISHSSVVLGSASDDPPAKDYCDVDFPMGQAGTTLCQACADCTADWQQHKLTDAKEDCKEAAKWKNCTTLEDSQFQVDEFSYDSKPMGCFYEDCSEDPANGCYWYNPGDNTNATSTSLDGTPVCNRPRHMNGTTNGQGGCINGYKVITNEYICKQAATCLNYRMAGEFRIYKRESEHLEHPEGCFIDLVNKYVRFNGPSPLGQGTDVQGIPICIVAAWDPLTNSSGYNMADIVGGPAAASGDSLLNQEDEDSQDSQQRSRQLIETLAVSNSH